MGVPRDLFSSWIFNCQSQPLFKWPSVRFAFVQCAQEGRQPTLTVAGVMIPHAYIDVRGAHAPQIVNNFGPGMQLRRRHSTPRWDHKCRCSTVKNGRGKVIVSFVFYRTISGLFALMERIVSLMKTEWGSCRCLVLPGQVVMCRGLSVGTTAHYQTTQCWVY